MPENGDHISQLQQCFEKINSSKKCGIKPIWWEH